MELDAADHGFDDDILRQPANVVSINASAARQIGSQLDVDDGLAETGRLVDDDVVTARGLGIYCCRSLFLGRSGRWELGSAATAI